jgi:aminoglycoside phosphotransferase family enzyme/predicted kinase
MRSEPDSCQSSAVTPFAAVRETHAGVVFLVGDRAYKLKKPVDLGFLDFRTVASRRAACQREVQLNRRLAPDVYLGVGTLSTGDDGAAEPLVVMRRMPDHRRLSSMVRAGADLRDTVTHLARMIASFHAGAGRGPRISAEGTRDAIASRWTASFEQVRPFHRAVLHPVLLPEIERLTMEFLDGRAPLFDRRVAGGRVVDGHGDLLADDIFCLDDGPRVLDCLDFDDQLRYLDGLDDVAFLAMDLEQLGAADLSNLLLDRYADFAGDPAPASLRHHYIAYRAFVRAKVGCLRHDQGDQDAAGQAGEHAALALRHLRAGRVRLVLVGGLPGVGKSTVAGLVADELGAVLLSSDRIRKELAGRNPHDCAADSYCGGIYDGAHSRRTYDELLHRAGDLAGHGESVVIDASWTSAPLRELAAGLAKRSSCQLVPVLCHADPALAAARLRARHGNISDADERIAAAIAADADPWPAAIRVSTERTPQAALRVILDAITGAGHHHG